MFIVHSYSRGHKTYFDGCTWSYDVLFSMVKEQNSDLYQDYQKVKENVSDY